MNVAQILLDGYLKTDPDRVMMFRGSQQDKGQISDMVVEMGSRANATQARSFSAEALMKIGFETTSRESGLAFHSRSNPIGALPRVQLVQFVSFVCRFCNRHFLAHCSVQCTLHPTHCTLYICSAVVSSTSVLRTRGSDAGRQVLPTIHVQYAYVYIYIYHGC